MTKEELAEFDRIWAGLSEAEKEDAQRFAKLMANFMVNIVIPKFKKAGLWGGRAIE